MNSSVKEHHVAIYTINEEKEEFVIGDIPNKSLEERILRVSLRDWLPLVGLNYTLGFAEQIGKQEYKPTLPETLYYGTNYLSQTPFLGILALLSINFELYDAYKAIKLRLKGKRTSPVP